MVNAGLAPTRMTGKARHAALTANLKDGTVGGVPLVDLNPPTARNRAFNAMDQRVWCPLPPRRTTRRPLWEVHRFYNAWSEPGASVICAARIALTFVAVKGGVMQAADLALDSLSLASICFLAAAGLANTCGVMRVIHMIHGEFITMAAYTGDVVQLCVPRYTVLILIALPLAFAVTLTRGVAMGRLATRHLHKRPLKTPLATFGISIALQQVP